MTEESEVMSRAIALLEAEDPDDARTAEAMLDSITWGEGIEVITQESVQDFCWYRLPMKWMVEDEERHEMVKILAKLFRHMGMPRYADVCESKTTTQVLHAYERSNRAGIDAFRKAEVESGVAAPSTDVLTWGDTMGSIEASARSNAATFLELAITSGELNVGGKGWKRKQAELIDGYLTMPRAEFNDRSLVEAINDERFERWVNSPQRGEGRAALIEPLIDELRKPTLTTDPEVDPVAPLRWFLEQVGDGLALTQTGNCNRAFVVEASRHFDWWNDQLGNLPNNENELVLLTETRELAAALGLVRKFKKSLMLTPKGRKLVGDHDGLWRAAATKLLHEEKFSAFCGELVLASLLGSESVAENALHEGIAFVAMQAGWRKSESNEAPDLDAVRWGVHPLIYRLEALCAAKWTGPWRERKLQLTESGRPLAIETLRFRSIGPWSGPFG